MPTVSLTSLYAARVDGITGSVIDSSTSLLERQTHDIVRMAMGSPAAEAIPSATFGALLGELAADGPSAFDYGPTEGDRALRGALIDFLAAQGTPVDPDELLITSGGMQGLDLVCKLFVEAGDLVAVESPTYTNGAATISGYEGRMVEIPGDADGMDVDALARVADDDEPPKLIYTIPTFQNPAGTTLSLERRERLIELADGLGRGRARGRPLRPPALRGRGPADPARAGRRAASASIGVRTFSKILAPGLRVGWVEAEPEIVARMIDARQGDGHVHRAADAAAGRPLPRRWATPTRTSPRCAASTAGARSPSSRRSTTSWPASAHAGPTRTAASSCG